MELLTDFACKSYCYRLLDHFNHVNYQTCWLKLGCPLLDFKKWKWERITLIRIAPIHTIAPIQRRLHSLMWDGAHSDCMFQIASQLSMLSLHLQLRLIQTHFFLRPSVHSLSIRTFISKILWTSQTQLIDSVSYVLLRNVISETSFWLNGSTQELENPTTAPNFKEPRNVYCHHFHDAD